MLKFQAYRLFSENAHKMFDVTLISIATITMIKCLAFSLLINDKKHMFEFRVKFILGDNFWSKEISKEFSVLI